MLTIFKILCAPLPQIERRIRGKRGRRREEKKEEGEEEEEQEEEESKRNLASAT